MTKDNALSQRNRWGFKRRLAYNFFLQTIPPLMHLLFEFKYEGLENVPKEGTGVILASNHQSFFDHFFIGSAIPFRLCHFVASRKLMSKKGFSWVKYAGAFPIDQGKGRAKPAIQYSIDLVKDGSAVVVYPEGERSRTGKFLRARAGLGRIAHQSKGLVLPIYIEGARDVLRRGQIGPAFGARVFIKFGKPLDFTKEYAQPLSKEVAQKISEKTLSAVKLLQHEAHQ